MRERGFYTNRPDNVHSYDKAEFAKSYGAILERLDLPPGSKVLEFGTGKGEEAQHIREVFGAQVVELDATAEAYRSNPAPERGFVLAEYRQLPYADNSFDFIHCKDVLIHIQEKDQLLAEFRRVLKPHGLLVLTTELEEMTSEEMAKSKAEHMSKMKDASVSENYFLHNRSILESIIARVGFKLRQNHEWTPDLKKEKNWYDKQRAVWFLESTKK